MNKWLIVFGLIISTNTFAFSVNQFKKEQDLDVLVIALDQFHPLLNAGDYDFRDGVYDTIRKVAYYNKNAKNYFQEIVLHEIGHFVWQTKLNNADRRKYTKAFESERISPTTYGLTSVEENFAETYAFRFMEWKGLEFDTPQLEVIDKYIK